MNYLEQLKSNKEYEYCEGASAADIQKAEEMLGITFPEKYRNFLAQCGMCNYADTNILGIFTYNGKVTYSVADITLEMRETAGLDKNYFVLDFQDCEYLILYNLKNNQIYGADVYYDDDDNRLIAVPQDRYPDFDSCFEDFMDIANADYN